MIAQTVRLSKVEGVIDELSTSNNVNVAELVAVQSFGYKLIVFIIVLNAVVTSFSVVEQNKVTRSNVCCKSCGTCAEPIVGFCVVKIGAVRRQKVVWNMKYAGILNTRNYGGVSFLREGNFTGSIVTSDLNQWEALLVGP